jgi:hypothetical protein
LPSTGRISGSGVVMLASRARELDSSETPSIVTAIYNSLTGHEFARTEAYLDVPINEVFNKPLLLAVEAEIRLDAIPEGDEPVQLETC